MMELCNKHGNSVFVFWAGASDASRVISQHVLSCVTAALGRRAVMLIHKGKRREFLTYIFLSSGSMVSVFNSFHSFVMKKKTSIDPTMGGKCSQPEVS